MHNHVHILIICMTFKSRRQESNFFFFFLFDVFFFRPLVVRLITQQQQLKHYFIQPDMRVNNIKYNLKH